ncbi:MAG: hypothetical protein OXG88_05860 [Gammaproteobacteria bacterium]|nr:hypothetical protein [Gammaproteobacteria bacterium]
MEVLPAIVTTLGACVVAVVSTTASAWLAVPLALRRFRFEKRWEKQADAYERVLTALATTNEYFEREFEAVSTGTKITEAEKDNLYKRHKEGEREIATCIALSGFLLSVAARERLKQLQKELDDTSNEQVWDGYLYSNLGAISNCINDLSQLASEDLQIYPNK